MLAVIVRSRLCIPIEVHGYRRAFEGCRKAARRSGFASGVLKVLQWPCQARPGEPLAKNPATVEPWSALGLRPSLTSLKHSSIPGIRHVKC